MSSSDLDAIYFRLHRRVTRSVVGTLGPGWRRLVEWILIAATIVAFSTFVWLHRQHVLTASGSGCLVSTIRAQLDEGVGGGALLGGAHALRIRVSSPRTVAADSLWEEMVGMGMATTSTSTSSSTSTTAASEGGKTESLTAKGGAYAAAFHSASAAGSATCTRAASSSSDSEGECDMSSSSTFPRSSSSAPAPAPAAPASCSFPTRLTHTLATYLLARRRGALPRMPAALVLGVARTARTGCGEGVAARSDTSGKGCSDAAAGSSASGCISASSAGCEKVTVDSPPSTLEVLQALSQHLSLATSISFPSSTTTSTSFSFSPSSPSTTAPASAEAVAGAARAVKAATAASAALAARITSSSSSSSSFLSTSTSPQLRVNVSAFWKEAKSPADVLRLYQGVLSTLVVMRPSAEELMSVWGGEGNWDGSGDEGEVQEQGKGKEKQKEAQKDEVGRQQHLMKEYSMVVGADGMTEAAAGEGANVAAAASCGSAGAPLSSTSSSASSLSSPPASPASSSTTTISPRLIPWAIDTEVNEAMEMLAAEPDLAALLPLLVSRSSSASGQRVGGSAVEGDGAAAPTASDYNSGTVAAASAAASRYFSYLSSLYHGDSGSVSSSFPTSHHPQRLLPEASFLYSPDRGLLSLHPSTRASLGLLVSPLFLDASSRCMGHMSPARWLMERVVGYDTAVLNAVLAATGGKGYVASEHSREVWALSQASEVEDFSRSGWAFLVFRLGTLFSAVFLVFSSSALVSFILAQTQQRMLAFTVALQRVVRARLPLLPLIGSHVVDSLVFVPIMLGVLFFLFEFFIDQLLAFLVLILVWACELWSITSCRTAESFKVFPRAFGLAMTSFHVYYLSYPFGYQYLCLASTALGLLATMWHLWSRYEVPALASGQVSGIQTRSPAVLALLEGYGWVAAGHGGGGGGGISSASPGGGRSAVGEGGRDGRSRVGSGGTPGTPAGAGAAAAAAAAAAARMQLVYGTPPRSAYHPTSMSSSSSSSHVARGRAVTEGAAAVAGRGQGGVAAGAGAPSSPSSPPLSSQHPLSPGSGTTADVGLLSPLPAPPSTPRSPFVEGLRTMSELVRSTAAGVVGGVGAAGGVGGGDAVAERHDRHDRLSLGGWA